MSKENKVRANHDSAWKDILDVYFKEFMEFFYSDIAKKIDWSVPYETLDKELPSITIDAMLGKRFVDMLFKVTTLEGKEEVLLIHVEVQGQKEDKFPLRLFQYYYRIFEKRGQSILTLAILTDGNKSWHPKSYQKEVFGFPVVNFNFWTHKLLDYSDKKKALETSNNPFAIVVLVHLIFLETKKDPEGRFRMKLQLTRRLYDKGYGRDYVINLLKVIDWALVIPENLELEYKQKLHELEEEKNMSYVTSFERLSRQEGLEQGLEQGDHYRAVVIAKKLIAQGKSIQYIQDLTGLSEKEVMDLVDKHLED
jgi:hypothetical protein